MAQRRTTEGKAVRVSDQSPMREWLTCEIVKGVWMEGYSRGADKTFLHVPQLHLGLDAGLCCARQPRVVLLTHTHGDHSSDIPFLCRRRAGVDVYCPSQSVEQVEDYVRAFQVLNLDGDQYKREMMPHKMHGVVPGERVTLPRDCGGASALTLEIFECLHTCPCVGYGVMSTKKRLASRLQGLSGKEIAAIRKSGQPVDEEVTEPMFCFLGDTSVEVFERNPRILEYPVVICECSFYPTAEAEADQDRVAAKADKHVLWADLRSVVESHPSTKFILIHCSRRHEAPEVLSYLSTELPSQGITNVVPFINDCRFT